MMLCDHAQVAGGKLFISGGGWSVTSTPTQAMTIALLLQVPWGEANRRFKFSLQLLDSDGALVSQTGPAGVLAPVVAEGELEVGRPPGLVEGSMLDLPFALSRLRSVGRASPGTPASSAAAPAWAATR